ncbi:XRE family transcriptional regulator [Macrococcoides bohemicum]|uniref:helix-turn-helix transcriptional regulator n=1 Tax=Macrococcoides bohemicum TaxID=1903056 RepID=UPI00105A9CE1|nr:helix-turn-helix transcriptional regulator [Macrococcus bohemicus]TDL40753.1 XRE family transcriptional regulator [Macrococcus bohemicus]
MHTNNLEYYRNKKKLTTVALSEKSKVSRMTIFKIENGFDNPSKKTMESLSNALNVPVEKIFFNLGGNHVLHDEMEVK